MEKTFTNDQINAGKIISTVRKYADNFYKENVPEFKVDKPEDFDSYYKSYVAIIQNDENLKNRFLNVFNDIIMFEAYQQHIFDNEFSRRFKTPSDPLRRATFEAFVNPINPLQYDGEALERVLHLYKRDVKKQVYIRNREDVLPVSINPEELMSAFQSPEAFMSFYTRQYKDLAHSNAIIEYNMIKQVINANYVSGALKYINVHGMTTAEINKMLKSLIIKMSKPSSKYNNYINIEGATGDPVITNTPFDSMLFIPNADLMASLDTEVLASAYNKTYAEITDNIIPVDDFGFNVYNRENQTIEKYEESKIIGMLCDENIFKFTEHLNKQLEGTNIASLTNQTFYHIWQTIALRTWANCILLVDDGEEPTPSEDFEIVFPDEGLNFENGRITLSYTGNLPENITPETVAQLVPLSDIDNVNINSLSMANIDKDNKTITFNFVEEWDGVKNFSNSAPSTIVLFNVSDEIPTFVYTKNPVFVNSSDVRVNYVERLRSIDTSGLGEFDGTIENKITLNFDPQDVTPAVNINSEIVSVTLISNTQQAVEEVETSIVNNQITIPANTLTNDGTEWTIYVTYEGVTVLANLTTLPTA